MNRSGIVNLVVLVLSLVVSFPLSMFAGYYGYDNGEVLIENSFTECLKSTAVIAQSVETSEAEGLEYWSNLNEEISNEFQNTVSRVIKSDDTVIAPSEEFNFSVSIASTACAESDKSYSVNHIYISRGTSWEAIGTNSIYIGRSLATQLAETGIYGSISFAQMIDKTITLKGPSGELSMTVGGIFYDIGSAEYYSDCLEDEVVYISLENTFKLDTSSTKGLVTYEEGSTKNGTVYKRISGDSSIRETYLHSESMRAHIQDIQSYRALNYKVWLCVLFSVMTAISSIVFLIFSEKVFFDLKDVVDANDSRLLRWIRRKDNYFLILLVVGITIACGFLGLGRLIYFSYGLITLPFLSTGSIFGVSLVVLIDYAILWIGFRSKNFIKESLLDGESKTVENVIVSTLHKKI